MKQPKYVFKDGISRVCLYAPDGYVAIGIAECHPDDAEFMSEHTGLQIAEYRATIDLLKHRIKTDIKPKLAVLVHLYDCMKQNKRFNPKSYESKMIRRQIRQWENDLATANDMIADEELKLKVYIDLKEDLYKKVRAHRNKVESKLNT